MISIKRGGVELLSVPICKGSKAKKELMNEDNITVVFSLSQAVRLSVGDYIEDNRFGHYILNKDYIPVYNTKTGGYDYNVQFDAYYLSWNNYLLKYQYGSKELVFELTSNISTHLDIVLKNLQSLGIKYNDNDISFYISTDVSSERKHIVYDNIHIIDALSLIAETYECEWWVSDGIIQFGKLFNNTNFDFEIGVTVDNMTPVISSSEIGNRMFVFGSTKNLPKNYRNTENTVEAIVQKKLMLPEDTPYIDIVDGVTQQNALEFVKEFEVYPCFDGNISKVTSYTSEVKNEDETTSIETFYRFKDNGYKFSKEYRLDNEDLLVKFTTGNLSGMEFTVVFNPNNALEKNIEGGWNDEAQVFEIIANENYGLKLPNTSYFPKEGDKYILIGWDSTKIEELNLVANAEAKLKEEALKYKNSLYYDSSYTCNVLSNIAKSRYNGTLVSIFDIGDGITLKNQSYFNGEIKTRVISYEYNLDYPYDKPTITVGDSPSYSRLKEIESSVDKIKYQDVISNLQGTNPTYVIGRGDKTIQTDRNVFSSLRSREEFLNKDRDDIVNGNVRFTGEVDFDNIAKAKKLFTNFITSNQYANGLTGFKLDYTDGLSYLEVDRITVRQMMTVVELLIQKMRSTNGSIVVSPANGKIQSIVDGESEYFITFEYENQYQAGDLIRCQTYTNNSKFYWVEISRCEDGVAVILKSEFDGYSTPSIGDETVLFGNISNTDRQSAILISSSGKNQPCIDILDGIKSKSLDNCLCTRLGNLNGITDEVFKGKQPNGYGLYSDNAYLKGDFILRNRDESVDTMFSITEDGIKASVESLQAEAVKGKTLLNNASFTQGLVGWITSDDNLNFTGGVLLLSGGSAVTNTVYVSGTPIFDNVYCLTVNNGWIRQSNDLFVDKPQFDEEKQYPLFFSVNVRCKTQGVLIVKVGENEIYNATVEPSEKFISIDVDGKTWNGQGDFYLEFTGVADFYSLTIYTEKTEVRHKAIFEVQAGLSQFAQQNIDNETGEIKQESGIMIKPNGTDIYVFDGDRKEYVTLGKFYIDEEGNKKIELKGDNIILSGDISANGKVHIDAKTGTITAEDGVFENGVFENGVFENGVFSGKVTSEEGEIGGFHITPSQLISSYTEDTSSKEMALKAEYIYFEERKNKLLANGKIEEVVTNSVWFGTSTATEFSEAKPTCRIEVDEDKTYIDPEDNKEKLNPGTNVGLYVKVQGDMNGKDMSPLYGNHAILCPKGDYAGFRLKTRRYGASTTLSILDNIVILTAQTTITVTLPHDVEDGQIYIIRSVTGQSFICDAEKKGGASHKIWSSKEFQQLTVGNSETLFLHFDGVNGYWYASRLPSLS